MPRRPIHLSDAAETALRPALDTLRRELPAPGDFPPTVLEAAAEAARAPELSHKDVTELPFFTIDPPDSQDLDQAMYLERRAGGGYRVHYAIADMAAFVKPGGVIDTEAHQRVETLYFPDLKVPLHPPVLSEGAASLLPTNEKVPALLWQHDLDAHGVVTASTVYRALVRSRAKLNYAGVQQDIDAGTAEPAVALLREIGMLREAVEDERKAVSLMLPDQEITLKDGEFRLSYRTPLAVEGWNEQISLMTGMEAAKIMLKSGTGILRTQELRVPDPVPGLREIAKQLGIDWKHHMSYADLIRSLDPSKQNHAAFLHEATRLFRKADYTAFRDGALPPNQKHASIAAPYAHCTAPMRRLVDRYTGELCVAACALQAPPAWVLDALQDLPATMRNGKAGLADGECVDIVEAALLQHREGETFDAAVIDTDAEWVPPNPRTGLAYLADPPVMGKIKKASGSLVLGSSVRAKLEKADPKAGLKKDKILFSLP
ncbi:ribonuclease catalytic domain-containing protein [Streptomyces sp. NRRL S-87]|uniref:ribonuclease catalytic domain-containing protein n=1 Tax=Streptomyces sp. NRRL S-87 TaxID=1463920 RepID=UPI0004BF9784|nr:RNB domain-containing ribonuclease [Streptomyces sp. NRRL S-87]